MSQIPTESAAEGVENAQNLGDMTPMGLLRRHAFARGLTDPQLEGLAALAQPVTFAENDVILDAGRRSTSFYLLTEGSVAVELRTAAYAVRVQALLPGEVFGWSALLDHQDTLFQVRARERTAALKLDGAALAALCMRDSNLGAEIFRRILQTVAGRVKATEERFLEMCGVKV